MNSQFPNNHKPSSMIEINEEKWPNLYYHINDHVEVNIADAIMNSILIKTIEEFNELTFYNGGYFERGNIALSKIRNKITETSNQVVIWREGANDKIIDKKYKLTISKRNEIIEQIKTRTFISFDEFDKQQNRICVKNGHIIIDKNNKDHIFIEHFNYDENPYNSLVHLSVVYNPEAECLAIDQFLSEVFGFSNVPLIYEILAYCLMNHIRYQKAFIFYGPPSTGKTTFIDLLFAFFSREFISQVKLQDLSKRFQLANLQGMLINLFDDLPSHKIVNSDIFRQIVTNNWLSSEMKNIQGNISWRNFTILLYTCNTLPELPKEIGDEFFRRWILIPCFMEFKDKNKMSVEDQDDPNVKEKDYNIIEKITTPEELSGLLNKVIEAWKRLNERGFFDSNYDNLEYIKGLWMMDINPVKLFIDECCEINAQDSEDYNVFWRALNKFRVDHNAKEITKTRCTQWLSPLGIEKKKRSTGLFYYDGIRINDKYMEKYGPEVKDLVIKKSLDEF